MRGQREQRVLVDVGLDDVGIDPDRRRIDDVRAGCTCRLEHVQRAAGVQPLRGGRVLRDEPHVGGRREVDDDVAVLGRVAQDVRVEQVAGDDLAAVARFVGPREHVEDARTVSLGKQPVDDMRADEAAAAGNKRPHRADPRMEAAVMGTQVRVFMVVCIPRECDRALR
jgi:hypothetical protein